MKYWDKMLNSTIAFMCVILAIGGCILTSFDIVSFVSIALLVFITAILTWLFNCILIKRMEKKIKEKESTEE